MANPALHTPSSAYYENDIGGRSGETPSNDASLVSSSYSSQPFGSDTDINRNRYYSAAGARTRSGIHSPNSFNHRTSSADTNSDNENLMMLVNRFNTNVNSNDKLSHNNNINNNINDNNNNNIENYENISDRNYLSRFVNSKAYDDVSQIQNEKWHTEQNTPTESLGKQHSNINSRQHQYRQLRPQLRMLSSSNRHQMNAQKYVSMN